MTMTFNLFHLKKNKTDTNSLIVYLNEILMEELRKSVMGPESSKRCHSCTCMNDVHYTIMVLSQDIWLHQYSLNLVL